MPTWAHTLDIKDFFHDDKLTVQEKRDEIVRRIKAAPFFDENDDDLDEAIWLLENAEGVPDFDDAWDTFYNWCDRERVWVATV